MEEQRNNDIRESDDIDTGTWVLALRENGVGYLGRVSKLDGVDAYKRDAPGDLVPVEGRKPRSEVPVEDVLAAELVTLNPVFDYREMVKDIPIIDPRTGKMMQDPNTPGIPAMQPMRTPLVMPVGFTLIDAPIHLRGRSYDFRFLSQMDRRDQETSRGFARDTRQAMQQARAQASGLTLPTGADVADIAKARARKT